MANHMFALCRLRHSDPGPLAPDSPWQNGRIESFNSRFRGELLSRETSDLMRVIEMLLVNQRRDHNHDRLLRSLADFIPVEFATHQHK